MGKFVSNSEYRLLPHSLAIFLLFDSGCTQPQSAAQCITPDLKNLDLLYFQLIF